MTPFCLTSHPPLLPLLQVLLSFCLFYPNNDQIQDTGCPLLLVVYLMMPHDHHVIVNRVLQAHHLPGGRVIPVQWIFWEPCQFLLLQSCVCPSFYLGGASSADPSFVFWPIIPFIHNDMANWQSFMGVLKYICREKTICHRSIANRTQKTIKCMHDDKISSFPSVRLSPSQSLPSRAYSSKRLYDHKGNWFSCFCHDFLMSFLKVSVHCMQVCITHRLREYSGEEYGRWGAG